MEEAEVISKMKELLENKADLLLSASPSILLCRKKLR